MKRAKSTDLSYACMVYKQYHNMDRKGKRSARERLAAFGFRPVLIKSITQRKKIYGFDPATIDALTLLAYGWEDDELINNTLVMRVINWGTGLDNMSQMTGIPIEKLREVTGVQLR